MVVLQTILYCFGCVYDCIYQQATPRENYVCEMRIRALRTKPKKRNSVPKCFVSRNMKRPGKYAGLFRETKRRQKIVFRFCCFISDVFQLWPYQWMLAAPVTPLG